MVPQHWVLVRLRVSCAFTKRAVVSPIDVAVDRPNLGQVTRWRDWDRDWLSTLWQVEFTLGQFLGPPNKRRVGDAQSGPSLVLGYVFVCDEPDVIVAD